MEVGGPTGSVLTHSGKSLVSYSLHPSSLETGKSRPVFPFYEFVLASFETSRPNPPIYDSTESDTGDEEQRELVLKYRKFVRRRGKNPSLDRYHQV